MNKTFPRHALTLGVVLTGMLAMPVCVSAQSIQKHGDVNGDGAVSALDAQAILTAVVGLPLPGGFVAANGIADCSHATVAASDALIVLRYTIGLDVSGTCVGQGFGPAAVTIALNPSDTSVVINRTIAVKAVLKDNSGFLLHRNVAWTTSQPGILHLDSTRVDTAWFKGDPVNVGKATVNASADGVAASITIEVIRKFAAIAVTPQRVDTNAQIGSARGYTARGRDSLGAITNYPSANWVIRDAAIASIVSNAISVNSVSVQANSTGSTWLVAASDTNSSIKDSVEVVVRLPVIASCSASGGTLHPAATYTTPQTWTLATSPHYVTGFLNFNSGSSLTVEPGVLVCFNGTSMQFHAGARMIARGTPTDSIRFTATSGYSTWGSITFGDNVSYSGVSPDTSVITNAVIELGGSTAMFDGMARHALVLDSVHMRQSNAAFARVLGPGSRVSRSVLDTVARTFATPAVYVGRGRVDQTTIRNGQFGDGIELDDAATIFNVDIIGGIRGVVQACCTGGARLNEVRVTGTTGIALDLPNVNIDTVSANVLVSGGTGGAFRGTLGNLGILFGDDAKQATLAGNGANDTLYVTGGTLVGKTLTARTDLPWSISSSLTIDTLAQLVPQPGVSFNFTNGSITFQRGGTLNAVGTPTQFIRFGPTPGGFFSGIAFSNPGPAGNPVNNPTATSTLSYVRVDSASGLTASGAFCCSSAVSAGDRHKIVADSLVIRKSISGALYVSAPTTDINRSVIDTTGNPSSGFATSQHAVILGDNVTFRNSLVRRVGNSLSGAAALYLYGNGVTVQNVRVRGSQGVAVLADNGIIATSILGVRADSANAYPFRGKLQNLAALAPTAANQIAAFMGGVAPNGDNRLEITGGTLSSVTPFTMEATPQLRWLVTTSLTFDGNTTLAPQAGSLFQVASSYIEFRNGATLNAVGTPAAFIKFTNLPGGQFSGLAFSTPPADPNPAIYNTVTSTLTYVQVDSATGTTATGGICCTSAINSGTRHIVLMDSVIVSKATSGAVWLNAYHSDINRSVIDTTGAIGTAFTTNNHAVVLGDSISIRNSVIRRAGNTLASGTGALYLLGNGSSAQNVTIRGSRGLALLADNGIIAPSIVGVHADSANGYPFRGKLQNLAALAPTAANQVASFIGALAPNGDNRLEITGGTLSSVTPFTMEATPQLRWLATTSLIFDGNTTLAPQPGSLFQVASSYIEFRNGATLNAVGTPGAFIKFTNLPGGQFSGLAFSTPPADPNPAIYHTVTSTMTYVQVDSATGTTATGGICCTSAINSGTRHIVLMDSVVVSKATSGAVWLNAYHSDINRSVIDTTGAIGSGYTTNNHVVVLGDSVSMRNSVIRRAGNSLASGTGALYLYGNGSSAQNVTIRGTRGLAVLADNGNIAPSVGAIHADSANGYPFRGKLQNLAALAPTALQQVGSFIGALAPNGDNRLEITGGTLSSVTPFTMETTPQLRWLTTTQLIFDGNTTLAPQPGSLFQVASSSFAFRNGATLNAVGTPGAFIKFTNLPGGQFSGLEFSSPPADPNPAIYNTVTSTLTYVQVDSATGTTATNGICCTSAINGGTRHIVLMDSVRVTRATSGAVFLNAYHSDINRSVIDTTGAINTAYTTSNHAVVLGDSATIRNSVIRRAGNTFASGAAALYLAGRASGAQNTIVRGSKGVAVLADNLPIALSPSGVFADSANALPFRGKIENLAALAPTATEQITSFHGAVAANANERLEITGGTVARATPLTLEATPTLPWLLSTTTAIDANVVLTPQPGSSFRFSSGAFAFQNGGTLNAVGAPGNRIVFAPANQSTSFGGLAFSNPATGTVTSTLSYVLVDSASGTTAGGTGTICCTSAINSAGSHVVLADSVTVHRSFSGAVFLAAATSQFNNSLVDTTGAGGAVTTNNTAVAIGSGISLTGTTIRRAGTLQSSGNAALVLVAAGTSVSDFIIDGSVGDAVNINGSNTTVSSCDVLNSAGRGLRTTSSYTGVHINGCDIVGNAGLGVENATTNGTYLIDATGNWWGTVLPVNGPPTGGPNNISTNVDGSSPLSTSRHG